MQNRNYPRRRILHWLTAPFIFMLIIPLVFFDILLEIYHHICFPVYRITLVNRSKYIKIDRHKLKYLEWWEKFGCAYCGYGNGWLHYASEIAARTEKYWCGIMHQKDKNFKPPKHHKKFIKYGDKKAYKKYKI